MSTTIMPLELPKEAIEAARNIRDAIDNVNDLIRRAYLYELDVEITVTQLAAFDVHNMGQPVIRAKISQEV